MARRTPPKPKAKPKAKATPKPKVKAKAKVKKQELGDLWDDETTLPIDDEADEIIEGEEEETSPPLPTFSKRYVASLQSEVNPTCFKHFADSDNLKELMKKAESTVDTLFKRKKINLGVLVHDRDYPIVLHRYNLPDKKANVSRTLKEIVERYSRFSAEPERVKEWVEDT